MPRPPSLACVTMMDVLYRSGYAWTEVLISIANARINVAELILKITAVLMSASVREDAQPSDVSED